jgi:hypothetical protein
VLGKEIYRYRGIITLPPMRAKAPVCPTSPNTHTHTSLFIRNVYNTAYGFPNKTEDAIRADAVYVVTEFMHLSVNNQHNLFVHTSCAARMLPAGH